MVRSGVWKAGQTFKFALLAQSPHYLPRDNGAAIGFIGNSLIRWINRHFERILF